MKKLLQLLLILIAVLLQSTLGYAQTFNGNKDVQVNGKDTILPPIQQQTTNTDTLRENECSAQDCTKFELTQRNKQTPLFVFPQLIRQDDTLIANYLVKDSNWMGKIVKIFSFYLPNGTKAADAIIIGISKDNCSLQTYRDNNIYQVEVKAIDDASRIKILAQYLVAKGYL